MLKPRKLDDGTELLELYVVRTQRGNTALLTGEVVNDARQTFDEVGQPAVDIEHGPYRSQKMGEKSLEENINNRIAIVLDNYVYFCANSNTKKSLMVNLLFQVVSLWKKQEDLANILKAGS